MGEEKTSEIVSGATASKDNTFEGTNNDEIIYPTGVRLFVIMLAVCLAILPVALDNTIIAPAVPRITDRFKSVQDIGWYGSVSKFFAFSCSFY